MFFFAKKNKKLLFLVLYENAALPTKSIQAQAKQRSKSFWSFFKKGLLAFPGIKQAEHDSLAPDADVPLSS